MQKQTSQEVIQQAAEDLAHEAQSREVTVKEIVQVIQENVVKEKAKSG